MNFVPYNELDIVRVVKIVQLRCLGYLFRMHEMGPCRRLTVLNPEGTRSLGKPNLKWLESVEEDLKKMCVGNCSVKLQGREQWSTILEEATCKVQREL